MEWCVAQGVLDVGTGAVCEEQVEGLVLAAADGEEEGRGGEQARVCRVVDFYCFGSFR
jgi:hypothetical protein